MHILWHTSVYGAAAETLKPSAKAYTPAMLLRRYSSNGQLSSLLTHAGGSTTAPRPIGFAARQAPYSHFHATPTSYSDRSSIIAFGHGAQPWAQPSSVRTADTPISASRYSASTSSLADARWDRHRRISANPGTPTSSQVKSTLASWLDSQYGSAGAGTRLAGSTFATTTPSGRSETLSNPWSPGHSRIAGSTPPFTPSIPSLGQSTSLETVVSTEGTRPGILKSRPLSTSGSFIERLHGPIDKFAWTDLSESDYTNVSKRKGRRIDPLRQTTERKQRKLEEAHFAALAMASQLSSDSSIAKFLKSVTNSNYRKSIAEGQSYFKSTQGDSIFDTQKSLFDYADATEQSLGHVWQDVKAVRSGKRLPNSNLQSTFESYARTHREGRNLIDKTLQRGFHRSYRMTSEETDSLQSNIESARARYRVR